MSTIAGNFEKKFFGASTGFEPEASALALQCSLESTAALTQRPRCDGHMLISFVFPQFTSFHSVFHSFHGLMNSINWPASSVWVFIAQLGEHCSANAEATGSNPVEAPKNFFSGYFRNCLNCDSLRWSHAHFTVYYVIQAGGSTF